MVGMPLGVADDLAGLVAGEARAHQGHALVELDAVADLGGLADHDARAVVDEEPAADRGPGVDVDAGLAVAYSVIIRGISGTPRRWSSWAIR